MTKLRTRPRIEPTKIVRSRHRVDEEWPGLLFSTWTLLDRIKIRRERRYRDREHRNLQSVAWQLWAGLDGSTGGIRIERQDPRTSNW